VPNALSASSGAAIAASSSPDELAATLREIAGELRAIRTLLEKRPPSSTEEASHV